MTEDVKKDNIKIEVLHYPETETEGEYWELNFSDGSWDTIGIWIESIYELR